MLIDLHVHTRASPSCDLEPTQALQRAEALGLDGICFTDLNTLEGAAELHALRKETKLAVLVGTEISTDHGYYLVFFPDAEAAPEPAQLFGSPAPGKAWGAREVMEQVKARGGVVVAAHPYDRSLERPAGDFLFTMRGLAAVEGYSGRHTPNVNELAIEAADHLSVPCIGGSGARTVSELGTAATLFRDEVRDEAQLVEALRSGAVWAVAIGAPPKFLGDTQPRSFREGGRDERPRGRDDRSRGRGGGRRRRGGRGGGR